MRILFCNIAWMRYYKGFWEGEDEPVGGGSFVDENQDGSELYNFDPFLLIHEDGEEEDVCAGFVVTKKSQSGADRALHIERLEGCEALRTAMSVEDVLVVYCAMHPFHRFTRVVGWYRHATVYRYYQWLPFADENDEGGGFSSECICCERKLCIASGERQNVRNMGSSEGTKRSLLRFRSGQRLVCGGKGRK